MAFVKATKKRSKLRCAFYGPSGSGKTYSMLRIATGLAGDGKIGVIDSERGSASKYADKFSFDVCDLEKRNVDEYADTIRDAAGKFDVLCIDSASHAWQELLEEVEQLAKVRFRGNKWAAWQEGTPKQKRFIDAILSYPGHVLITFRAKTEWLVEEEDGKKTPKRVGLSPEARPGSEYEWDMLVRINPDHTAIVEKDRTGKYQDKMFSVLDEAFGHSLSEWLNEGGESNVELVSAKLKASGLTEEALLSALKKRGKVDENVNLLASVDNRVLAMVLDKWDSVVKALSNQ